MFPTVSLATYDVQFPQNSFASLHLRSCADILSAPVSCCVRRWQGRVRRVRKGKEKDRVDGSSFYYWLTHLTRPCQRLTAHLTHPTGLTRATACASHLLLSLFDTDQGS